MPAQRRSANVPISSKKKMSRHIVRNILSFSATKAAGECSDALLKILSGVASLKISGFVAKKAI